MAQEIAFWAVAAVCVAGALGVVIQRDVFRASLLLVLCFLGVAGVFVTLSADFLAAVQVLIYVGAISVLIILAIMLTREVQRGSLLNRQALPALIVSSLLLAVMLYALTNTSWPVSTSPPPATTTSALALRLFSPGGFILPVEMAAVLLLAAIIGAIVTVRDR